MSACARCGHEFSTHGEQTLCSSCRRHDDVRDAKVRRWNRHKTHPHLARYDDNPIQEHYMQLARELASRGNSFAASVAKQGWASRKQAAALDRIQAQQRGR